MFLPSSPTLLNFFVTKVNERFLIEVLMRRICVSQAHAHITDVSDHHNTQKYWLALAVGTDIFFLRHVGVVQRRRPDRKT